MFKMIIKIFTTELLQIKKDQRTIIAMFILPILMIPAILGLAFSEDNRVEIVCVFKSDSILQNIISNSSLAKKYSFIIKKEINENTIEDYLLLELNNNEIILLISSQNNKYDFVAKDFQEFFNKQSNIDFNIQENISIDSTFKTNYLDERLESVYSGLYTVIIIFLIVCFSGPALVSADISAGEKERKTLESLLLTKCPIKNIIIGKYLTVLLFSFIPLTTGIIIMYITAYIFNTGILYLQNVNLVVKLIFPYCIFMSAFLLKNGFKAKTIRAAKSTESLFFVFILIVNIFMIINSINIPIIHIIPIVNTIYFSLNGTISNNLYLLYLLSYLFFAYLLLKKTYKLLNSEDVFYSEN